MEGSSGLLWAKAARRAGLIDARQAARWMWQGLKFRLNGATDEETDQMMAAASDILEGVPAVEIGRLTPEVLAGVLPRIHPEMLATVHEHQDAGRPTFIVTASGVEMAELLAKALLMDGAIGTRYEIGPDGAFTGRLDGPFVYGEGKVREMERFSADHDLDLGESWAYSDSVSDLPMLRAVGNPVAVNPDEPLAKIARAEGWPVIRFDKLRRKIAIGGATAIAATAGGLGAALSRRQPQPNRLRLSGGRGARVRRRRPARRSR
jgi:HAD superfamily hydrolase (TIGR01490 family)